MIAGNGRKKQNTSTNANRLRFYGAEELARLQRAVNVDISGDEPITKRLFQFSPTGAIVATNAPPVASEEHHDHDLDRSLIYQLLKWHDESAVAERWARCHAPGQGFVGFCEDHPDQSKKYLPFSCECRICPTCLRADMARFIDNYGKQFETLVNNKLTGYRIRHVVLTSTLGIADCPLDEAKARYGAFVAAVGKLIKKMGWNKSPAGCIRTIEAGERGFKLHAHLLVYCRWVDVAELRQAWGKTSPDGAEIVFIQDKQPKSAEDVKRLLVEPVKYIVKVTKYSLKDDDSIDTREAAAELGLSLEEILVRLLLVLKGQRRVQGYGSLFGLSFETLESLCPVCGKPLTLKPEGDWHGQMPDNSLYSKRANNSARPPPPDIQQPPLPRF